MGIQEDIQEIKDAVAGMNEEKKGKQYRLPFGKKVGKNQRKKNYVTVFILNENNGLEIKKLPITNQTILLEKIPRLAAAGYVFYWKTNPIIFLPSWSVEPISGRKEFLNSINNGSNISGYEILLAEIENSATKSKMAGKGIIAWVLGIGLAAIIGYAFLTGGA